MADTSRAAALAKLAELGVKADPAALAAESAPVKGTGEEVYAGGDVKRVLIGPAHLTYRDERNELLHAFAELGDTVLLTEKQAKRLDGIGATATEADAAKLAKAPATPAPTGAEPSSKTDEELEAMNAAELVAHVNQHAGDKVRVRGLEGKRDEPRKTVLKATAPEGADDEDEELDPDEE